MAERRPLPALAPPPIARDLVAAAIESLLALLDAMDGDADLEPACEDEGAQCDDEGADTDREPDLGWPVIGGQGPVLGGYGRQQLAPPGDYVTFDDVGDRAPLGR